MTRTTLVTRTTLRLVLAVCMAGAVSFAPPSAAQGNPPGTVTVSAAATGTHAASGDLHGGGDAQWSNLTFSAGVSRQFVPAFWGGVSMRFGVEDWSFRARAKFGGAAPWKTLHHPAVALNLNLAVSKTLVIGASPTLEWAYDSGGEFADAKVYGGVISVAKVVTPNVLLGAGASVTRQFYNVKTSPFAIVNVKLGDRWRVANAIGSGPLGGAGVELRYAPAPQWELAGGGVSRSDRFRLRNTVANAGRVGQASCVPLLLRVSRKLGAKSRIDLYAGATVAGRIELRDSDGHELAKDTVAPAPAISASVSVKY